MTYFIFFSTKTTPIKISRKSDEKKRYSNKKDRRKKTGPKFKIWNFVRTSVLLDCFYKGYTSIGVLNIFWHLNLKLIPYQITIFFSFTDFNRSFIEKTTLTETKHDKRMEEPNLNWKKKMKMTMKKSVLMRKMMQN